MNSPIAFTAALSSEPTHDLGDLYAEQEMVDQMARTLFVHAWTDYMEETHGETHSGQDLFEAAPPITDVSAFHAARTLVMDLVLANGGDRLAKLWDRCECPEQPSYTVWASRVASQRYGSGIRWDDNGGDPKADLIVPSGEFGAHSLHTDYDSDGNSVAVAD